MQDWNLIKSNINCVVPWCFFYNKTSFFRSKNGIVLVCGYCRFKHVFIIGDIDKNDIVFDSPAVYYFQSNNLQNIKASEFDFLIDWDEHKIKKYKQKNSTERKVKEQRIKIYCNEFNSQITQEYNKLFEIWSKQTKGAQGGIRIQNHVNCLEGNFNITYRQNGELVGLQSFSIINNDVYFVINTLRHDSGIGVVYPLELFKCPLHYFGAQSKDCSLFKHKVRICDNKFIAFETITVPSKKQSAKIRQQRLTSLLLRV